jgi:hypothetical protein
VTAIAVANWLGVLASVDHDLAAFAFWAFISVALATGSIMVDTKGDELAYAMRPGSGRPLFG